MITAVIIYYSSFFINYYHVNEHNKGINIQPKENQKTKNQKKKKSNFHEQPGKVPRRWHLRRLKEWVECSQANAKDIPNGNNSRHKDPEITKCRVKSFDRAGAQHQRCEWKAPGQIRCWRVLSPEHGGRISLFKQQGAAEEGVCHELVPSLCIPFSLQGKTGLEGSKARDTKPVRKLLF